MYEIAVRTHSLQEGYTTFELGRIRVVGDRVWDIDLGDATAIGETQDATPHRFVLEQNYPNPFNGETVIGFSLEREGRAEVVVYNLLGQRVRVLRPGDWTAGEHAVRWDGRDETGRAVASGVYLYRLATDHRVATRKLLLLK